MRALKVWGTSESVPKLLTLLDDEDQFFRGEVLQALVATKDPRVVPHLASGFADDFFKRSEAARHLRAMGPIAESALWPHTASNDWQVAQEACHVLRDIGTRRSLPALQLATQHANPIVKNAAASAIKEVEAAKRTVDPMPAANSETPVVASRGLREWKDASGKNKIQAEFVEFASGKVKLKTRDGRTLALTLAQLSPEDRRHVIELMQQQP
jgi:HEAT repeat protein